jgi:hypothetical protein
VFKLRVGDYRVLYTSNLEKQKILHKRSSRKVMEKQRPDPRRSACTEQSAQHALATEVIRQEGDQ